MDGKSGRNNLLEGKNPPMHGKNLMRNLPCIVQEGMNKGGGTRVGQDPAIDGNIVEFAGALTCEIRALHATERTQLRDSCRS